MKFEIFVKKIGKLPVFQTEILISGIPDSLGIKVQMSRWVKAGKLIQLKRGIYMLSDAYRKTEVYEPYIATILKRPSYISLEKALEYHGLIPEAVPVYTSITTKRPAKMVTPAGTFVYRHVKPELFWGYSSLTVGRQTAFMAHPEKALLDFFYLNGMAQITPDYLEEMRLQSFEKIVPERLMEYADKFKSPGITRAANTLVEYMEKYKYGEKEL